MKENTLKCSGAIRRFVSRSCAAGVGVLLVSAMASSARADIKYTQETRMNEEQSSKAPTTTMTRTVSPIADRMDTRSFYGKMQVNQSTIRLCEKNQEIQVDDGLKIYTIKPLNEKTPVTPAGEKPKPDRDKVEPKTGKIVATYDVDYLGEEEVAGFKTRHYMIATDIQRTGCAGDGGMESKVEIWVSDIKDATPCAQNYDPATAYAALAQTDCKLSFEQKGDFDAFTKAYSGIIMRQKIYMGDKVLMTQEVTLLSQAKLDNDPFAIPADYKQVTAEEFQTEQSAAMMKAMMTGEMEIGEDAE